MPKVLDFGLAKALASMAAEASRTGTATSAGLLVGHARVHVARAGRGRRRRPRRGMSGRCSVIAYEMLTGAPSVPPRRFRSARWRDSGGRPSAPRPARSPLSAARRSSDRRSRPNARSAGRRDAVLRGLRAGAAVTSRRSRRFTTTRWSDGQCGGCTRPTRRPPERSRRAVPDLLAAALRLPAPPWPRSRATPRT